MARSSSVGWLCVFVVACGAGPQHDVTPVESSIPTGTEAASEANATDPQLASALEEFCRVATELASNRATPLHVRMEQLGERLEATAYEEVLDAFFDRLEERAAGRRVAFDVIAEQAEADGVPRYRCEPLARMLTLHAAGDEDLDPSLAASAADDLERMCAISTEVLADRADPAFVWSQIARRWDAELTNPAVRRAIAALAATEPAMRYQLLEAVAAEEGVQAWTCPALLQAQ